jgi:hypothetical protein
MPGKLTEGFEILPRIAPDHNGGVKNHRKDENPNNAFDNRVFHI